MQNQRQNHLLLLASRCGLFDVCEVTATVTQKHVNTVRRAKRRASDTDVTKSIQVVQTHVSLVRCKCSAKLPALSLADLHRGRSQMTSIKRNSKINVSSFSCELESFPMDEEQRIIHISSKV